MTRVRTKLPVDFVMRSIIMTLIFGCFVAYELIFGPSFPQDPTDHRTLALVIFFLVSVSLFDLYLRKGYAVLHDGEKICWRKVGLSRDFGRAVSLRFADIREVFAVGIPDLAGKIEGITLASGYGEEPDIILSTQYIHDDDLNEILRKVEQLSDATIDDAVLAFMAATTP